MNTVQYQNTNERVAKLPQQKDGKPDIKWLSTYIAASCRLYYPVFVDDSRNKDIGNRSVIRSIANDLVLNRLQIASLKKDFDILLQLNHDNIEKILYIGYTEHFCVWITPLFVTKLKTVWVKIEQFRIFDVKKMFMDLLKGLEYMKSKNIASGVIHEDNLAYNGTSWYISGIVNAAKQGESASGVYIQSSIKSPRYLKHQETADEEDLYSVPEDDLWQLILMYVITYYGFNPFHDHNSVFSPKQGTLLARSKNIVFLNIIAKRCQDITLTTKADCFGIMLKTLLTSIHLDIYGYDLFRYIIEHNGTVHTEGLDDLLTPEIRASLETKNIISVNIDQYITKFKECECIICFSNTIKYRFKHCNHEICCHSCFDKLKNRNCPICRQPIVKTEELSVTDLEEINKKRKQMYFEIKSE